MRSYFFFFLLFAQFCLSTNIQGKEIPRLLRPPPHPSFPIGEEKTYFVRYGLFEIGTMKGKIVTLTNWNGHKVYKIKFTVRSSEILRKVTLGRASIKEDLLTYVDKERLFSRRFFQISESFGRQYTRLFDFNYEENHVMVKVKDFKKKTSYQKKVKIAGPLQDGISTLTYVMSLLELEEDERDIPTMGTESVEFLDVKIHRDLRTISLYGKKIKTRFISGKLHYEGFLGLEGSYEGFFHRSWPHWPVLSKLKVWIGWVTVTINEEDLDDLH